MWVHADEHGLLDLELSFLPLDVLIRMLYECDTMLFCICNILVYSLTSLLLSFTSPSPGTFGLGLDAKIQAQTAAADGSREMPGLDRLGTRKEDRLGT